MGADSEPAPTADRAREDSKPGPSESDATEPNSIATDDTRSVSGSSRTDQQRKARHSSVSFSRQPSIIMPFNSNEKRRSTTASVRSAMTGFSLDNDLSEKAFAGAKRRIGNSGKVEEIPEIVLQKDEVCSTTGLTGGQMNLIVHSWQRIIGDSDEEYENAGKKLVDWAFDHVPGMRTRFTQIESRTREELFLNVRFQQHVSRFMGVFHECVRYLNQADVIIDTMKYVALIHLKMEPPVDSKQFQAFAKAFPTFLQGYHDPEEDAETINAWVSLIDFMFEVVTVQEGIVREEGRSCCVLL